MLYDDQADEHLSAPTDDDPTAEQDRYDHELARAVEQHRATQCICRPSTDPTKLAVDLRCPTHGFPSRRLDAAADPQRH